MQFGKSGFKLVYLWYDIVGNEGGLHRKEIDDFSEVLKKDKISFHAISYQDLIMKLKDNSSLEHEEYINYLTERYL